MIKYFLISMSTLTGWLQYHSLAAKSKPLSVQDHWIPKHWTMMTHKIICNQCNRGNSTSYTGNNNLQPDCSYYRTDCTEQDTIQTPFSNGAKHSDWLDSRDNNKIKEQCTPTIHWSQVIWLVDSGKTTKHPPIYIWGGNISCWQLGSSCGRVDITTYTSLWYYNNTTSSSAGQAVISNIMITLL